MKLSIIVVVVCLARAGASLPVSSQSVSNALDKLHSPFTSGCFKRISIGQRLILYDVTRTVRQNTVKGCEDECNIYECTFFSFGISAGGNGTCELSTGREISKREATDYDLYQRTNECSHGKPTGYEEVCYRRVVSRRRLHQRFIRHSLPCDTLEACQHQCSIEKHFECQGFNIRQRPGGGICELSSIPNAYLDPSRDFRYDPEFDYYERERSDKSPNCGSQPVPGGAAAGGPQQHHGSGGGGGSYPSWSPSRGGPEPQGNPWSSHRYGTGNYGYGRPEPGRPSDSQLPGYYYGGGNRGQLYDIHGNDITEYRRYGDRGPGQDWGGRYPERYPSRRQPGRVPTYVILDSGPGVSPYPKERPPSGPPSGGSYPRPSGGPHPRPSSGGPYPGPPFAGLYPGPSPGGPYLGPSSGGPYPGPSPGGPYPGPSSGGPYPGPPEPPASGPLLPGRLPSSPHPPPVYESPNKVCFQRARIGYRVDPKWVRGFHAAPTILDCEAMCTKSTSFECTGYSYRYSGGGNEPNCALADFSHKNFADNLLPDRSCDFYYKMPACSAARSEETDCFLKTFSNQRIAPEKIREAIIVRGVSDCELECLRSYRFTCRSFTFRYGPGVIGEPAENCFLSDWPVKDLHPTADYIPGPGCEVYERGSYGHGCEFDSGPPSIGPGFDVGYPFFIRDKYHWTGQETWRHFTVRGWPCRSGTRCQLNPEAGFWSCEVEGGERGQWDYCCKPGHQCGFSRGYYYPWCYVGEAGPDQWRPCSEQYYPDYGNPYHHLQGGHTSNTHHGITYDGHKDEGPWNYGHDDYGPPSYWPVLYLYTEPPPNETEHWTFDDPHHSIQYLAHDQYHHYNHHDDHPVQMIRFRNPSKNRFTRPKGIVLKIDVTDRTPASDPGFQSHKDEARPPLHIHPRYNDRGKNVRVIENDINYPYHHYNAHDCQRESLKLEDPRGVTTTAPTPALNYTNAKRELWIKEKSKGVIRDVEQLIKGKTNNGDVEAGTGHKNETTRHSDTESLEKAQKH